jgi:hypothetical protein
MMLILDATGSDEDLPVQSLRRRWPMNMLVDSQVRQVFRVFMDFLASKLIARNLCWAHAEPLISVARNDWIAWHNVHQV